MTDNNTRQLVRNFLLELLVYGLLVILYFLAVLRFLGDWLAGLFGSNLAVYAFLSLGLMLLQGVFLDAVTSFLLDLLKLERLD